MVRIEVDAGEQAGDVGVLRIGGVKFFQQRDGLGSFGGIVGGKIGAGDESGEGGIGWVGGEGGREQSFGVCGAALGEQDVGQRGDSLRVASLFGEGEVAAVGALCGGQVGGGLGDLGGKHDVFGGLGREVEGGEQLGGGGRGIGRRGLLFEPGQGAEGACLEGGRDVGELGCGEELAAGLGRARRAGQQQAEGDVWGGEEWVGGDGLAVAGLSGEGFRVWRGWVRGFRSEGFEGEAEVVEHLGVVGGLGVEASEDFEGGGEVAGGQRVVGLLDERGFGRGFAVGVGEVLCGERGCGEQSGEKEYGRAANPRVAANPRIAIELRYMGHPISVCKAGSHALYRSPHFSLERRTLKRPLGCRRSRRTLKSLRRQCTWSPTCMGTASWPSTVR